jgi:translocation and assembly module TamA
MRRYFSLFLVSLLLLSASASAQVTLTINGVDGALRNNIDAHLSSIDSKDYSTSLRFRSRIEESITQAMNALGYYHPEIDFEILNDAQELVVNISRGPVAILRRVDIVISGDAQQDEEFKTLIENSPLHVGAILNHQDYDNLKSSIQSLGLNRGYFNATFSQSRLAVSPETNQAFVTLHYDSGVRFRYGDITINGSQIDEKRVRSLMPFEQGEPYLVSDIGEFNQRLSNTEWFSSILIQPQLDSLEGRSDLPMDISLAPAARNQLETGLGYSTDVGVRGSLSWKKPWLGSTGHSLDTSLTLSQPEQTVTASYKIPLSDVLNQYYLIDYGLKNVDSLDTQSLESNLSLKRFWHLDNGWNRTISIRYLIENYEQGVIDDIAHFVLPGVTFSRTRSRGQRLINWGDKISVTAEYGNQDMFSDTEVLRLLGSASLINTFDDSHRVLLRANGGANIMDDYSEISPSLRFFAGGDNSIRGYGYESISPTDSSGELAGAKFLTTASVEYQYQVYGNWWIAAFYDLGDAFDDKPDWKRGQGIGLRWVSPIGPLRLDFAKGLDADPGDQFRIHFTIGPEL